MHSFRAPQLSIANAIKSAKNKAKHVSKQPILPSPYMKDIDKQHLYRLKDIFREENLTWDHVSRLNGNKDRSSLRNSLLRWLTKANRMLNTFGYKVEIVPLDETKQASKPAKSK